MGEARETGFGGAARARARSRSGRGSGRIGCGAGMVVAVALRQAKARFGGHPLPQVHIMRAADHVPARVAGIPFEKDVRALLQRTPVAHRADAVRSGDEQAAVPVPRMDAAGLAIGAVLCDTGDHRVAAGQGKAVLVVDHAEIGREQVGERLCVAALERGPEQAGVTGLDPRGEGFAGGRGGAGGGRRGAEKEGGEGHGGISLLYCLYHTVKYSRGKTFP